MTRYNGNLPPHCLPFTALFVGSLLSHFRRIVCFALRRQFSSREPRMGFTPTPGDSPKHVLCRAKCMDFDSTPPGLVVFGSMAVRADLAHPHWCIGVHRHVCFCRRIRLTGRHGHSTAMSILVSTSRPNSGSLFVKLMAALPCRHDVILGRGIAAFQLPRYPYG